MANPNRTVAAARKKWGKSEYVVKAIEAGAARRRANSPFTKVMDRVSSGELTPEQGAAEVKRLMEEGG
jgi:hypothetical protein